MRYDESHLEEAVPALLAACSLSGGRSGKGCDFDIMDRLHAQGMIENPRGKAKSVVPTPEGLARGERAAQRLFGAPDEGAP